MLSTAYRHDDKTFYYEYAISIIYIVSSCVLFEYSILTSVRLSQRNVLTIARNDTAYIWEHI